MGPQNPGFFFWPWGSHNQIYFPYFFGWIVIGSAALAMLRLLRLCRSGSLPMEHRLLFLKCWEEKRSQASACLLVWSAYSDRPHRPQKRAGGPREQQDDELQSGKVGKSVVSMLATASPELPRLAPAFLCVVVLTWIWNIFRVVFRELHFLKN